MRVCERCNGTGKYLGQGFMTTKCTLCGPYKVAPEEKDTSLDKLDRRSKSYKQSIKDIMDFNPDITQKEAVKLFDEAYLKGA